MAAIRTTVPFRLLLVSDRKRVPAGALLTRIEAALRGGVDAVQLREKDLPARALFDLAHELRALTRAHGARLLINDRIDVALAVAADGVHLPADSFAVADARSLLGEARLIGVSTHSPAEAQAAAMAGADYIVFGPIFETASKRPYGPPLGLDALATLTSTLPTPVLAIGGIHRQRAAEVRQHGAAGVAVIDAILGAADPRLAAAAMHQAVTDAAVGPAR